MFVKDKKYVITGAIGSGKTSIINELKKRGFYVVEEVAESFIMGLQKKKSKNLPWLNRVGFQNAIFPFLVQNHENLPLNEVVFFDRGFPDEVAFFMQEDISLSDNYAGACKKYEYEKVFLLSPWEEIYEKISTRPWSFSEVKKNFNLIVEAYNFFGYDLIEVPNDSIEKRVDLMNIPRSFAVGKKLKLMITSF